MPAVEAQRLQPEALRTRLKEPPVWAAEFTGDGGFLEDRPPAAAAVLVPLVLREAGLQVLLTRRTAHLRAHGGQISFPGGRVEPEDSSPTAAALREAREEIGLEASCVEVLGELPRYRTVTRFDVHPVVAFLRPPLALRPDPQEVAAIFEVPLAFLMDPSCHRRHRFERDGAVRHFYSMPWHGPGLDAPPQEWFIWGATAAMLRNLYRLLQA